MKPSFSLNNGRRRLLAGLPLLATGLFLNPALADPQVRQAFQNLMGTRVDITVQAREGDVAEAAVAAAFAEMARLSDLMSRYLGGTAAGRGGARDDASAENGPAYVRAQPGCLRYYGRGI